MMDKEWWIKNEIKIIKSVSILLFIYCICLANLVNVGQNVAEKYIHFVVRVERVSNVPINAIIHVKNICVVDEAESNYPK